MFFRYFVTLCAVVLCAVAINAEVEDVPTQEVDFDLIEERANPAAKVVAKLIRSLFTGAANNCISEAAKQCKGHWKNPGAAISCAKNFVENNKGRCAVGK